MKIYIKLILLIYTININAQVQDTIYVQSITATKSYQGAFGTATIQIDDAGNDELITKPLIIAEGLDTGLMAQAGSIGDSDILTFIEDVEDGLSNDLSNLLTGGNIVPNGDQDYDIIYVNWDNGTDFIQRNAYVLEEVITWVNEQKALAGSTEPNVVLGQSMGGLIARYALRDMENDINLDHDTSLYISHDAPHQGAHIPLGILHMGRHLVNEFIETPLGDIEIPLNDIGNFGLITIDELLDTPAINQMLIYNVDTSGSRTNTAHTNWQNELQLMGYPQLTRNIALSNASHCATTFGLTSNQQLVNISGHGDTSAFTDLILSATGAGALIGDFFNDTSTFLLGLLPGGSELSANFTAKAYPTSGSSVIYKGKLTYKKTLLWLVPITRTITDVQKNSPNNIPFYDNFPGGAVPNAQNVSSGGQIDGFLADLFLDSAGYSFDINLNFDFIPVTSALDVGSGNTTLSNNDYYRVYTGANPPSGSTAIPFQNFTTSFNTSGLNEPHISFNTRNGNWLATELNSVSNDEEVFNCSFICDSTLMAGDDVICSTGVFTVPNVPVAGTAITMECFTNRFANFGPEPQQC